MKIYVKNLPFHAGNEDLLGLFATFGAARNATVIVDHQRGGSRGFGFVEFDDPAQGRAAIEGLNGKDWQGRELVVDEAHSQGPSQAERRGFRAGPGDGSRGDERGGRGRSPRR